MNEKNFAYLKDQVKFTGFGEALEGELRQNIEQSKPEFKLTHDTFYENTNVNFELNFRKSEQTDLYFFNSYNVKLQKEGDKESIKQTFYINRGNNITVREACNLMEGRAVNKDLTNKEGEVYNAWVQMDFKNTDANGNFKLNHYHENYGFNLEQALAKQDITPLNTSSYNDLTYSLKKGNLQPVDISKDGKETRQYMEVNPQFKTITVYDSNMKKLDSRREQSQKSSQNKSAKQKNRNVESQGDAKQDSKQRRTRSM